MIYWLSPVPPGGTVSGGTRKLWDLSAVLRQQGYASRVVVEDEWRETTPERGDLVVIPEVYGTSSGQLAGNCRWVSFIQNPYLMDPAAYLDVPQLVGVMVESAHTEWMVRKRVHWLPAPIFPTRSSGVGRMGGVTEFTYGEWPRERWVMYFGYKHAVQNELIFRGLELPDGWELRQLYGNDDDIALQLRRGAILAAPLAIEGFCATTQEAALSGALIVCWPGGPSKYSHHSTPSWAWALVRDRFDGGPMEYLQDRAYVVAQDDVEAFRWTVELAAGMIESGLRDWGPYTKKWSDDMRRTYSRDREVSDIVAIMERLCPLPILRSE